VSIRRFKGLPAACHSKHVVLFVAHLSLAGFAVNCHVREVLLRNARSEERVRWDLQRNFASMAL
jgi:hypothetical protein